MIKSLNVSGGWFEMVRDEGLRFLVVDNTALQLNRGDVVNISTEAVSAAFHCFVTFVTNYGQAPGWVAFGFRETTAKGVMNASMVNSETIAETMTIAARSGADKLTASNFESAADYNEYLRLTRKMNENTSKKPTLQMQNRYQEFKSEREKIKIKTKRERENG